MKLINSEEQLLSNIRTVEHCLADGTAEEQYGMRDLIRRGRCFVAYKVGKEIRFAPSRFLGYVDNNLQKHNLAKVTNDVDGGVTNARINRTLKQQLFTTTSIEIKYLKYCSNLGIVPSEFKNRRYWLYELENDFEENELLEGTFPEGKIFERIHKSRERNSRVIAIAKANFKKKHNGRLYCQVCKFDFEKTYGKIGKDFIEGHHTFFVSDMKEGHETKPEEIALLCPNCHRMVHKKRPWLTMDKLNSLLTKTTKQTVHE